MKSILSCLLIIILLSGCWQEPPPTTPQQADVIDSLSKALKCQVSYGTSVVTLRPWQPFDFIVTIKYLDLETYNLNDLSYDIAQSIYPVVVDKGNYKDIIVTFEWTSGGNVGIGADRIYTYPFDAMQ